MATIELVNVSHSYTPGEWAVRDINLKWEHGVSGALLGPSGCGKTTLLKIISGLLKPTAGQVLIDGRDVTDLSPRERDVAQVFQFPVVYETLTVYQNLEFPLRNQGMPKNLARQHVLNAAKLLGLENVLNKNASRLNPAEKQRISLGRGLVREDIATMLLDEPLTMIDPHTKWQLRRQLKQVQQRLEMTMIYVTHDQHEALTFAEQVTVMNTGVALQTGTPQDLHERPRAPFVGYFIGSPGMNIFTARLDGNSVAAGDIRVQVKPDVAASIQSKDLKIGIRPEFVEVTSEPQDGGFPATITNMHLTANSRIAEVNGGGLDFKARLSENTSLVTGDEVSIGFPPEYTIVYADDIAIEYAHEGVQA